MSEPTEPQWAEIQDHLFAGRKIQAIKAYREATHCGLAEAKEAMEAYARRLRQEGPDRFAAPEKSGCAAAVLLILGPAALLAWRAWPWA
ncbi:MAG TPA: hypothetical protein VER17_20045 [Tepidisphaeraceae bacterium]|nr:hypothetical protein [Tepidisphaeraceae bacterium]